MSRRKALNRRLISSNIYFLAHYWMQHDNAWHIVNIVILLHLITGASYVINNEEAKYCVIIDCFDHG